MHHIHKSIGQVKSDIVKILDKQKKSPITVDIASDIEQWKETVNQINAKLKLVTQAFTAEYWTKQKKKDDDLNKELRALAQKIPRLPGDTETILNTSTCTFVRHVKKSAEGLSKSERTFITRACNLLVHTNTRIMAEVVEISENYVRHCRGGRGKSQNLLKEILSLHDLSMGMSFERSLIDKRLFASVAEFLSGAEEKRRIRICSALKGKNVNEVADLLMCSEEWMLAGPKLQKGDVQLLKEELAKIGQKLRS